MIEVRPGGRRRIDRVLGPGYLSGVGDLPLKVLRERRDEAAQEETDLSYLRRLLHARIDIVRAEQTRRSSGGESSIVDQLATILADNALGPAAGSGRHQQLEPSRAGEHRRHAEALIGDTDLTDVSSLTDDKLAAALDTYAREELSVSSFRREVQGRHGHPERGDRAALPAGFGHCGRAAGERRRARGRVRPRSRRGRPFRLRRKRPPRRASSYSGPEGDVRLALGDVDVPIFPRSANKPLQAAGMLRAGLPVAGEQLAMVTASHSGEPEHIERILELLADGGFGEDDLRCPPSLPLGEGAQRELLASGGGERRAAMNCSGKHGGMLRTCAAVGWPADAYLDPRNPVQQSIRDTLAELTGHHLGEPAVDGCGAPLWPVPLRGLATAFQRLVHAETGTPERAVADVMRGNPWLVGGTDRDVTR